MSALVAHARADFFCGEMMRKNIWLEHSERRLVDIVVEDECLNDVLKYLPDDVTIVAVIKRFGDHTHIRLRSRKFAVTNENVPTVNPRLTPKADGTIVWDWQL